jgi:ATP:ADP antiporter, AAA family
MIPRLRRFLDLRPGEGLPVLVSFLYIATVVAAFLLAKPIRNSLFLRQYGPYAIVYVYVAVPLVLSLFVPAYTRVAARFGTRTVTAGTLVFFSLNALLFWFAFRFAPFRLLPGVFYVWVNCFAVIAPVQAWSFANSLFDTRQARRLFGLLGASASLGAIAGGVMATVLVGPVGGTENMLLVLAVLILIAAGIVAAASALLRGRTLVRRTRAVSRPFAEIMREIARSPYLRLIAALLFVGAIVTQWAGFQLNIVAKERFGDDVDGLLKFFGTFNFVLGSVSFVVQVLLTRLLLRRFGVGVTILVLPVALIFGSTLTVLLPGFATVLLVNALDQGLRFSVDKATYELLYLPIAPAQRLQFKSAIDILVNRLADAAGALLFGFATRGFLMIPGLQFHVRGTAAINIVLLAVWIAIAWRLRVEYVRTIQESIHRHRLDSERTSADVLERSAADALNAKLRAGDPTEVRYALALLEVQQTRTWHPALRDLLSHPEPDVRRRALAILAEAGDRELLSRARAMLRDRDVAVRTEALLYVSRELGVDPLREIERLGDFEDFSIRAGMAAFLASPGPSRNMEAARIILEGMVHAAGPDGARERAEAARVIALVPDAFLDLLAVLLRDEDVAVARQAIRSARTVAREELIPPLLAALGDTQLADEAADALARFGNTVVPILAERLPDESTPLEVRREIPTVLVRVGTAQAQQVLVDSVLQGDATLRHRIIASLNKVRAAEPGIRLDANVLELLLAAEIAGHYRSYQVLGPLRAHLKEGDPVLEAMRHSMEQELERIFRLMALLLPQTGLHDAYVGVRSTNPIVRANALEFLDNVLKPELRQLLVPLLDAQVTIDERIALADRLVGAPLDSTEQAIATLLASEDAWLRSCAVYAVGALQLHALAPELRKLESASDPVMRESVRTARRRLAGEADVVEPHTPAPAEMDVGVGAG